MNIRKLEDLTKEELIELVKHERGDHNEDALDMVPGEWKLVPVEPTEAMLEAGADVEVLAFGEKHTFREIGGIYEAMLAAFPQPDRIPDDAPTPMPPPIAY